MGREGIEISKETDPKTILIFTKDIEAGNNKFYDVIEKHMNEWGLPKVRFDIKSGNCAEYSNGWIIRVVCPYQYVGCRISFVYVDNSVSREYFKRNIIPHMRVGNKDINECVEYFKKKLRKLKL